jgi:hypothetical protein
MTESATKVMLLRLPISLEQFEKVFRQETHQIGKSLHGRLGAAPASTATDPGAVVDYFQKARKLIDSSLEAQADRYSSFRWLWYLRRLPRFVFEGHLSITYPYDSSLAEALSATSARRSPYKILNGTLVYPIKREPLEIVMRFCVGVIYLSQIHSNIRLASKGVEFEFADDALGKEHATHPQIEAIELYDKRGARGFSVMRLHGSGTIATSEPDDKRAPLGMFVNRLVASVSQPLIIGGSKVKVTVDANFAVQGVSLENLEILNRDPRLEGLTWWPEDAPVLLLTLYLAVFVFEAAPHGLLNVQLNGYLIVPIDSFLAIADRWLAVGRHLVDQVLPGASMPTSGREVVDILSVSRSDWPAHHSPMVRREGDCLCLDLSAATEHFQRALIFSGVGGGAAPNVRGEHFEDRVQQTIDASPWRPPASVRELKGRTLKRLGRSVTDIDALGTAGKQLLLISCKSRVKNLLYDGGDYSEVRNAATYLVDAAEQWIQIKAFFQSNPVGDNYDFSPFTEIIAVVCTPSVFYVPIGIATDFVAEGLLQVSSIDELSEFVMSSSDGK